MIKIFGVLLIALLISCSTVKKPDYGDDAAKVVGLSTWDNWKINSGWNYFDAFEYNPEADEIKLLIDLLNDKDYQFVVFATTYCDDCKDNIPKLFKLFNLANIPSYKISLYGLDERLEEPSGAFDKFDVTTTPTVYLTIDNKIIGTAGYPYLWLPNFIEILENYKDKK